jgi:hypothetical protein
MVPTTIFLGEIMLPGYEAFLRTKADVAIRVKGKGDSRPSLYKPSTTPAISGVIL